MSQTRIEGRQGNWISIRKQGDEVVVCDFCHIELKSGEAYSENTTGKVHVVCEECVSNIVRSRLRLLEQGG